MTEKAPSSVRPSASSESSMCLCDSADSAVKDRAAVSAAWRYSDKVPYFHKLFTFFSDHAKHNKHSLFCTSTIKFIYG